MRVFKNVAHQCDNNHFKRPKFIWFYSQFSGVIFGDPNLCKWKMLSKRFNKYHTPWPCTEVHFIVCMSYIWTKRHLKKTDLFTISRCFVFSFSPNQSNEFKLSVYFWFVAIVGIFMECCCSDKLRHQTHTPRSGFCSLMSKIHTVYIPA